MNTGPAPMRRPTAPASPQLGMTRADFERKLKRDYLVSEIRTGTFEEQTQMLTRPSWPSSPGPTREVRGLCKG
jgi:hypothetical protein